MRFVTLSMIVAAVSLRTAAAEPGSGSSPCAGELPAPLVVPAGNELAFALGAEGVQIYSCAGNGGSYGWELRAPEARLFEARGRDAGMHYAGPTWESTDGSRLVGAKVAAATPDAAAIPWLLLRATSHAGSGRMGKVTFVQRMKTWGGNAPNDGCDAAHADAVVRVPYRAVYCFYQKGAGAAG
jgi:hypothetical protein